MVGMDIPQLFQLTSRYKFPLSPITGEEEKDTTALVVHSGTTTTSTVVFGVATATEP
jgi:hypothetical protein